MASKAKIGLLLTLASALVGAIAETPAAHASSQAEWVAFGEPGRAPGRTVAIAATEMKFTPNDLVVAKGETIRFVVTNRGRSRHEFVIGDQAFQARHMQEMAAMPNMAMAEANALDLAPGQTKILVWRFTRTGEFLFDCDLPGHAIQGMTGHIHVR
jgi:uncharacterized cupredoxin-like copper-binding protein